MKTVIRAFFRTLRTVLGPFMLLKERLTQPTGMQRESAAQATVDLQCQSLALYQFSTCPTHCCKAAARPKYPASKSPTAKARLNGCKTQTPSWLTCARILAPQALDDRQGLMAERAQRQTHHAMVSASKAMPHTSSLVRRRSTSTALTSWTFCSANAAKVSVSCACVWA